MNLPTENQVLAAPTAAAIVFEAIPAAVLGHARADTPPGTRGAYAERGPVFIHADPCDGYRTPHAYPPELRDRPQVVRAYNADGEIADGVLAWDGDHALTVITDLLARPDVSLVHLRNVGYGCYNFAARIR